MSFEKIRVKVLRMAQAFDVAKDSANGAAKAAKDASETVERFSDKQKDTLNSLAEQFNQGFGIDMKKQVEHFLAILEKVREIQRGGYGNLTQLDQLRALLDQYNRFFQTYGGEFGKSFDWRTYFNDQPAPKKAPAPRDGTSSSKKASVKTGIPSTPTVIFMPNSDSGKSTGNLP